MSKKIPLLLFAKAPIAGRVKTRLQPYCTPEQSADIAKILVEETVKTCVQFWPGEVKLSVWLDAQNEFLQSIADQYHLELVNQCDGDLGNKMQGAFESHGYPAAIIGCDAPHVQPLTLRSAFDYLNNDKSVIAPSDDGGYYLIGLAKPCSALFEGVSWGERNVYSHTKAIAQKQRFEYQPLANLNDIDTWQDVLATAKQLEKLDVYINDQQLV